MKVQELKKMNRYDLRSGMLVTLRDKAQDRGRVFLNVKDNNNCIIFPTGLKIDFNDLNLDLTNIKSEDHDIIEIRIPINLYGYIYNNDTDTVVTWERKKDFKIKDLKTGMIVLFGDTNPVFNKRTGRVLLNTELGNVIIFNDIEITDDIIIDLTKYSNNTNVEQLDIIKIFKPNKLKGYLCREFNNLIWEKEE